MRRVALPGSWLAAWMYGLLSISPPIDQLINDHHYQTLEKYWDYERKYVDANYSTIPFPFEEIACPRFSIHLNWTLDDLEGYLDTWSALQKFIIEREFNPVKELIKKIQGHWQEERMKIEFPLYLRMGKIIK